MASYLFASDVKMVAHRVQKINLQESLDAAQDWSEKYDLQINPAKCNYLTIGQDIPWA